MPKTHGLKVATKPVDLPTQHEGREIIDVFTKSNLLKELLNDHHITIAVAQARPALDQLLTAAQSAMVTPENAANIGPAVLACGHLRDLILLFAQQGANDTSYIQSIQPKNN